MDKTLLSLCSPFDIIFARKIKIYGLHSNEEIYKAGYNQDQKAASTNFEQDKRKHGIFEEGDKVLVKMEPQNLRKHEPRYVGPFQIFRFLSRHQVPLDINGKEKPRTMEWLQRFQGPREGEIGLINNNEYNL